MHDEPRHLAPHDLRRWLVAYFNELRKPEPNEAPFRGDLCPFCRKMDNERLPTL